MKNGDELLKNRMLRESTIYITDALDKVKVLSMFPDGLHISKDMVADYYEVEKKSIRFLIDKNRYELERDGFRVLTGKDLISLKDMGVISKNASSFTVIPRRAVLRIGMLLSDSRVAFRIRNYLINEEEINRLEAPDVIKKTINPIPWIDIFSNVKAKQDLLVLAGASKKFAFTNAVMSEELESGIDLTFLKQESPAFSTEKTYDLIELGKTIKAENNLSGVPTVSWTNSMLELVGLQVKNGKGEWEISNKGKPYAFLVPIDTHDGLEQYPSSKITVMKQTATIQWRYNVMDIFTKQKIISIKQPSPTSKVS